MASVKFISFTQKSFGGLMPAPSVRETEQIHLDMEASDTPRIDPTPDNLLNKELKIISSYRGCLLYLEGGIAIHRFDPKTGGANGYTSWPTPGSTENVSIGKWIWVVEYL
jgi:hypothetical protein